MKTSIIEERSLKKTNQKLTDKFTPSQTKPNTKQPLKTLTL